MLTLHLYIPNLLKYSDHPAAKPLPALDICLSKARRIPLINNREQCLANLLGWHAADAPPIAALTYLADVNNDLSAVQNHAWLRADPVHLQADQRFLRLLDADLLQINADEAQQLCQALNAFYADDDFPLSLIAATPTRWYLKLTHHTQLKTAPLSVVRGDHLQQYLPSGADARWWQARGNEIQMFLHQHPINQKRQQQGQLTINSLWFWGQGKLPEARKTLWQQVFSNDALSIGLSRWTQTSQAPVPANAQNLLEQATQGKVLCILPPCHGLPDQIEHHWLAPLLTALQKKRIAKLILYPDNGIAYQLTAHHLWFFWRYKRAWFK